MVFVGAFRIEKGWKTVLSSLQNREIRQKERSDLPMFHLEAMILRLVSEAQGAPSAGTKGVQGV